VGHQRSRLIIAIIILLGAVSPVGIGVSDGQAPDSPTNETASPPIHQNPDNTSASSNLSELSAYFTTELSVRLLNSTASVSKSEYERARELVGDEYELNLSDYRVIALELDQSERTALFNQAQTDQQQYIAEVQRLRQLRSEYRQAQASGDEERARQLAREFNRETGNFTANASELISTYTNLSNETGISFEPAIEQITATQLEFNETTTNITQREFRETTLSARLNRSNISFTNPGQVTGRVALANGSGIGGEVVTIGVGSRQYEVQTDPNGRFQLPYRPVAVNASATTVSVTYQPADEGAYLPASDSISTNIQSVNASLDAFDGPPTVGFSDRLNVRGQVVVGDRVVSQLPFAVQANDVELTRTTTDTSGEFDATAEFPATVNDGEQDIRLRTTEPRAVQLRSNQVIRVEITSTQIRARVANRSLTSVEITGRLGTSRGESVVNQTVTLSAGSQEVQTRTAADGTFTASLELSRGSLRGGGDSVTVTFAGGAGTNLGSASTFVPVPPASVESVFEEISSPEQQLPLRELLIVLAVLATSGGALAVGSYRGWFDTELLSFGDDGDEANVTTDGSSNARFDDETRETSNRSAEFTTSREQLNRGEVEQAVLHSYGQIWDRIQIWMETDPQSHWALYNAVESTSLNIDEPLYELTSVYEQTAYSPTDPNFRTARAAVEAGESVYDALINDTDSGTESDSGEGTNADANG
jgi:chlorite dismutase